MAPRDYARLHFDWYEDEVLRAIGELEPAVMAIWPVLLAMAKKASHAERNPLGCVQTTHGKVAHNAMTDAATVQRVLPLLVEGGFITLESTGDGALVQPLITLSNFAKWQVPRSGAAERKQAARDASRGNVPERHGDVAGSVTPEGSPVTETETEDREEDQALSSAQAPTTEVVKTKPKKLKPEDDPQVISCFNWYCQKWGKVGTFALTLTPKRARAIQKALKEHGREKVAAAILGHLTNEWRHEALNRNDITTLLRDTNIDEGVERAAIAAGAQPVGVAPARSAADDMDGVY